MKEYLADICLSYDSPLYNKMTAGTVLTLEPEPENQVDPSAIRCLCDGVKVGYVANTARTVVPGHRNAASILRLMGERCGRVSALLTQRDDFVNGTGQNQKRFTASLFFVPKREEETAATETVTLAMVAGSHAKGDRSQFFEDDSHPEKVYVTRKDGKILFSSMYPIPEDTLPGGFLAAQQEEEAEEKANAFFDNNPDRYLEGTLLEEPYQVSIGKSGRMKLPAWNVKVELRSGADHAARYEKEMDDAVARCAGQVPEILDRVEVMEQNHISPDTIRLVLNAMSPRNPEAPARPKRPYVSEKDNLEVFLAGVLAEKHMFLLGPKGSGKNTLVDTANWILNRSQIRVQGNNQLDRYDLQGQVLLENGSTRFQLSPLMDALQTGSCVVIDEANMILPEVLASLHSVADESRAMHVTGYGMVHLNPKSYLVLTGNEGYAGTLPVNGATKDRTLVLKLQPNTDLSGIFKGYPEDKVQIVTRIHADIMKAIREEKLSPDAVSIRGLLDALDLSRIIPLKTALLHSVAQKLPDEEEAAVKEIIELYC